MPDRTGLDQTIGRLAVASSSNCCCGSKRTYGAELTGGLSRGGHCETSSQRENRTKPAAIAAAAAAAAAALTRSPINTAGALDYREYDVRHVARCPTGAGATLLRRLQPPSATSAGESRSRTLPSPRSACGGEARRHVALLRATCRRGEEIGDNDDYGFATVAAAAAAAAAAATAAARAPQNVASERMAKLRDAASATRLDSEPEGRRIGDSASSRIGGSAIGCEDRTTATEASMLARRRSAPGVVAAAGCLPEPTRTGDGRTDSPMGAAPWTYDAALKTWFSAAGGLAVHLDGGASTVQLSAVECRALRKLSVRRLQDMGVGSSAAPSRVALTEGDGGSQPVVATTADRVTAATARLTLVRWLKRNCKQVGIAVASAAGGIRKKNDDALGHITESRLSNSSKSSSPRVRMVQPTVVSTADAFSYCGARRDLLPHCPRVPAEARAYMAYLESRCLATVGLFRIGSTRRRIRELQAKFAAEKEGTSGLRSHAAPAPSTPDAEHNPHDVACLLKGYFRRLPDALLCCRLYHTFLSTREVADPATRLDALRHLVAVLPVPNRDLLYSLLKLLAAVASKARDHVDADGNEVVGNKMDSRNLAAMFGPCILRERGASDELQAAADMNTIRGAKDAIDVVAEMIDNWSALFTVTKELHDEILQEIAKTDSAGASFLLYTKAAAARQGGSRLPAKVVQLDPGNYVELATDPLNLARTAPLRDGAPGNFATDEPLEASRATYDRLQESSEMLRARGAEACRAGSIDSALSNSDTERIDANLAFYHARSATAWATWGEGDGDDCCVAEPSGTLSRTLRLERTRSSDADSGLSPSPREWSTAMSHSLVCNAEESAAAAFYYGGGSGSGLQPLTRSRSLNADDRLLVLPEAVTYV